MEYLTGHTGETSQTAHTGTWNTITVFVTVHCWRRILARSPSSAGR